MDAIVDNLRHLQALAINAATDTNTDDDRATIQKEIVQRLDEINDIASHTNFNGKYLLNGDYGKRTIYDRQTVTTSGVITTYTTIDTETEIISTTTVNTTVTVTDTTTNTTTREVATTTTVESEVVVTNTSTITTTTVSGVAEPTGTAVALSAGNVTISDSGVYDLAEYSGTLTISAANVKLTNSAGGTLNEVYIEYSGANKKLWLDGINITNSQDKSAIRFLYLSNVLCLCNGTTNSITSTASDTTKALIVAGYGEPIGTGLTITGNGTLNVSNTASGSLVNGALIGSDSGNAICGGITIDSGVTLSATYNGGYGAAIGSGYKGKCADIVIASGANVTAKAAGGASIGSGGYGSCTTITIYSGATVEAGTWSSSGAGIGSGFCGTCKNYINIYGGATVKAYSAGGAAIGAGAQNNEGTQGATCSGVWIYSYSNVIVPSSMKIGALYANGLSTCDLIRYPSEGVTDTDGNVFPVANYIASNVLLANSSSSDAYQYTTPIYSTDTTTIETTDTQTQSVTVPTTVTVTETTTETTTTTIDSVTTITETVIVPTTTTIAETSTGQVITTLVTTSTIMSNAYFQWGAKSNQSTALNINDMHTKSLRGEVPSRSDTERLNAMNSDSAEYSSFMATLEAASSLTLDDISVGTRENANVAICVINGALEYALDVSTTLGAHSKRMEFAAYNVTTMAENVQASESVIRDTDMAKAMTGYTKANVLRQAAQSMLAQANQNGANVLSLLRQ